MAETGRHNDILDALATTAPEVFTQAAQEAVLDATIRQRAARRQEATAMRGRIPTFTTAYEPIDPGEAVIRPIEPAAERIHHEPRIDPGVDHRMQGYSSILSALGYLLFKKDIISAGDYQLMSEVQGHDFYEIVTRIIQIADGGIVPGAPVPPEQDRPLAVTAAGRTYVTRDNGTTWETPRPLTEGYVEARGNTAR